MGDTFPQPMRPSGLAGRIFGALMNVSNAGCFRAARVRLALTPNARVLEIGFGTGKLIEMLAADARNGFVAGVDPSSLMVETARNRNRGSKHVDLREGDASLLPWDAGAFDAVAALHCWQFWDDPASCLAEIARVMRPGACLLIILRDHSRNRDKLGWLPNPLSRAGDETGNLIATLGQSGFVSIKRDGKVGSSEIVTAYKAD